MSGSKHVPTAPNRADSLDFLRAIEHGVEYSFWYAHPLIITERAELLDVSIRLAADDSQPIEKGEIQFTIFAGHCAPDVPWQHFSVIQRSDIADDVAGNKPKSVHVEDAKGARIGIFSHPMVEIFVLFEIGAETAACARR